MHCGQKAKERHAVTHVQVSAAAAVVTATELLQTVGRRPLCIPVVNSGYMYGRDAYPGSDQTVRPPVLLVSLLYQ